MRVVYAAERDTITLFAVANATSGTEKQCGFVSAWARSIAAVPVRVKHELLCQSGYINGKSRENPSHIIAVSGMPARIKSEKR